MTDDHTADAPPPTRRRLHALAAVGGILAAIVVAAVLTKPARQQPIAPTTPTTYEMRGFLALPSGDGVLVSTTETVEGTGESRCWGRAQYDDVVHGATLGVYDDQDTEVATGSLGPGRTAHLGGDQTEPSCVFPILVSQIPSKSGFYQVGIGKHGTLLVENAPQDGILYAFVALDEPATTTTTSPATPPERAAEDIAAEIEQDREAAEDDSAVDPGQGEP